MSFGARRAVFWRGAFSPAAVAIVGLAGSAYLLSVGLRFEQWAWVRWFALLPLFACLRVYRPLAAGAAGAAWGCFLYVFFSGESDSLIGLPGASGSLIGASVLSLLGLVLVPGLYALCGAWLSRRLAYSPVLLGLGWAMVEVALEPLGIEGGLLGEWRGGGTWSAWIAATLGYALVSCVVATINAAFVSALDKVCALRLSSMPVRGCSRPRGLILRSQPFIYQPALLTRSNPRAPPLSVCEF